MWHFSLQKVRLAQFRGSWLLSRLSANYTTSLHTMHYAMLILQYSCCDTTLPGFDAAGTFKSNC